MISPFTGTGGVNGQPGTRFPWVFGLWWSSQNRGVPNCSSRANAQGIADALVSPHRLYRRLGADEGGRQAAYRQLFRGQIRKQDLESIRSATHKGWALGNDRFCEKIETLTGRRAAPLPKGRPRKTDPCQCDTLI